MLNPMVVLAVVPKNAVVATNQYARVRSASLAVQGCSWGSFPRLPGRAAVATPVPG